jgi:hypothetical protein
MAGPDLSKITAPAAPVQSGPDLSKVQTPLGPDDGFRVPHEAGSFSDYFDSASAGLARGTAQFAGLPGSIYNMTGDANDWVMDKFGLGNVEALKAGKVPEIFTGSGLQSKLADISEGRTEYRGKTAGSHFIGTASEFVPGAFTGPGSLATKLVLRAAVPAIASEGAGNLAESKFGPDSGWTQAARIAGATIGGLGGTGISNGVRRLVTPVEEAANPIRQAAVDALRKRGIQVTAGQATNSPKVMGWEADTHAGQALAGDNPESGQIADFTKGAMQYIGSKSPIVTSKALKDSETAIGQAFDVALQGVDVIPSARVVRQVDDITADYLMNAPASVQTGLPAHVSSTIKQAAQNGTPIPATAMDKWRQSLGSILQSDNAAVKDTAYRLRDAIDNALDDAVTATGETWRTDLLGQARMYYRNFLAISGALKLTGQNKEYGLIGMLHPNDLMQSLVRQGAKATKNGTRGEIADYAKNAALVLKKLPAQGKHGLLRSAFDMTGLPGAIAGSYAGAQMLAQMGNFSPLTAALATGAAVATPLYKQIQKSIGSQAMRPAMQKYFENGLMQGSVPYAAPNLSGAMVDDRAARKSGGRVGAAAGIGADRLIRAAEKARKALGTSTEPLLNTPDHTVASALEVANRSI